MSDHTPLAELSPQLYVAVRDLAARLREAESSNGALRALLDALGLALLLVGDDGRPIFVNRRAARILAQRDGLAIGPNGLAADSRKTTRSLRAAIAGTTARALSSHVHPPTLRLAVPRPSSRPPWLISILPLVRDSVGGTGHAAISITGPDACPRIDPASAANYFLLTPRETDVAALLAAGRSSREAATVLHIRIGTVRTHLKSLFEKTGTRSQTALALKLQAFAIHD